MLETAERFGGQLPQPSTNEALAIVYGKAPLAVLRAIDDVSEAFENGSVRSPWGILKSRAERISVEEPKTQARNQREKTIERAEQWIRNAGMHYDRESEIEQELFGSATSIGSSLLAKWADDQRLRERMLGLWRERRAALPTREQALAELLAPPPRKWVDVNDPAVQKLLDPV